MPDCHIINFLGVEVHIDTVPRDHDNPWSGREIIVTVPAERNGCITIKDTRLNADEVAARFHKPLIVTRHIALLEHLRSLPGGESLDAIAQHAQPEDVKGRVVVGVLPLRLAALTLVAVEIPLHIPPELRGVELDLAHLRQYAGSPRLYSISQA